MDGDTQGNMDQKSEQAALPYPWSEDDNKHIYFSADFWIITLCNIMYLLLYHDLWTMVTWWTI